MSGELEAVLAALAVGKVRIELGEVLTRFCRAGPPSRLCFPCLMGRADFLQVPSLWLAVSFPSLKPLASYMVDLLARLSMLASWNLHGQPPAFWISGFFFTPSVTTAVLQNYARKHKLPIDEIGFDFEVLPDSVESIRQPPADGAYVHGLFLEGCSWDPRAKQLTESAPKVSRSTRDGCAGPGLRSWV